MQFICEKLAESCKQIKMALKYRKVVQYKEEPYKICG
jgi:hypothetical protein